MAMKQAIVAFQHCESGKAGTDPLVGISAAALLKDPVGSGSWP